jgi:hypothetical protein
VRRDVSIPAKSKDGLLPQRWWLGSRTDYEYEALGLCLGQLVLAHAMNDRTCEIAVENCRYVNQMKYDAENKKSGY